MGDYTIEQLKNPKVRKKVNEKMGTDWSPGVGGKYRVPIAFDENELLPGLSIIQIYISKDHPNLAGMWKRREKIIQKAKELFFFELVYPECKGDETNMECQFISFLAPIDPELELKRVKEFIGARKSENISSIREPSNSVHVGFKNWQSTEREVLVSGKINGYTPKHLKEDMNNILKRIKELVAIVAEEDVEEEDD